jgi:hypothetical protein
MEKLRELCETHKESIDRSHKELKQRLHQPKDVSSTHSEQGSKGCLLAWDKQIRLLDHQMPTCLKDKQIFRFLFEI